MAGRGRGVRSGLSVDTLDDDKERGLAENAQWKLIQKNTFTRWTNERLKTVNKNIGDLETDLSDGLRLIALVEVLSGKPLGQKYTRRPTIRPQQLENVTMALRFLERDEGIRLVNIDSSDIVDHKLKLILGLIWTLILHYDIAMPVWDDVDAAQRADTAAGDGSAHNLTPKQRLLAWIQNKIPDPAITNFTGDWRDGRAIGALVDGVAPGLCPDWEDWTPGDATANATEAMDAAEQWLDVPQLIRPDEMCSRGADELSMMTYLSQFPNAKLKTGAPLRPRTNANRVRAYGPGIESAGGVVGATKSFTVETFSAGRGDLQVRVTNPLGTVEPHTCTFNDDRHLTYSCTYSPSMEGQYKVAVYFAGREIPKSPYLVTMAGDPSKVTVDGAGVDGTAALQVNKTTSFNVHTTKAGQGSVDVSVDGPSANDAVKASISQQSGDLWRVEYTPVVAGPHTVNVYFAGQPVNHSPFTTHVKPAVDVSQCTVSGRGVQPRGLHVNDLAVFRVSTLNAGPGDLDVSVSRSRGATQEPVKVVKVSEDVYECSYTPHDADALMVSVLYAGQPVAQSPYPVSVGPVSKCAMKAYGAGLVDGVAGFPATFTVQTNDEPGALGCSVDGPSPAEIECSDNEDGSADVTYLPPVAGEYAVHVLCDDDDITGSPFIVDVRPTPSTNFDPSKVVVEGKGVERQGVVVNERATFTVDTRHAGIGDLDVAVISSDCETLDVNVVKDDVNKSVYQCSYRPRDAVKHSVVVTYGHVGVPQSPFKVYVQEPSDPSKVRVYGAAIDSQPLTSEPTQFTVDCAEAGPGDVAVSLYDAEGRDVAIETVDNGNNTFDVAFVPESEGQITAKVFFDDVEIPDSPFVVDVQPRQPDQQSTLHRPDFGQSQLADAMADGEVDDELRADRMPVAELNRHLSGADDDAELETDKVRGTELSRELSDGEVDDELRADRVDVAERNHQMADVDRLLSDGDFGDELKADSVRLAEQRPQPSGADDDDKSAADKVIVSGFNPELSANSPTTFTVDARCAQPAPLDVNICDSDGNSVPAVIKSLPQTADSGRTASDSDSDAGDDHAESGGLYQVQYTVDRAGPCGVRVLYGRDNVTGSPFDVVVNPVGMANNVTILSGCDDVIPVNQLHTIRLDTSRAGAGHVTCDVITETGSVMRAAADGGDDDDVREVTYTPTVCQTHNVYVYFGGQLIPDGHVLQQVVDDAEFKRLHPSVNQVVAQSVQLVSTNKSLVNGVSDNYVIGDGDDVVYRPVDFCLPVGPVFNFITASVKPPSGAEYQPQLTDKRDGSVLVHCVPKEPGLHQLSVAYNDLPVKGSPWEFNAERVDLGQMRAYGAGLRHGVATAPCQFTVHSGSDNNTPGGLSVAVDGPSKAEIRCADNADNTHTVTYYPMTAGVYNIAVQFAGKHIPGSPFTAKIIPPGQAETVSTSLTAGGQVKGLGVVESDVDNLSVTVTDTSGRQCSNAGLTTLPNGQLGVVFSAVQAGEHTVHVTRDGNDIARSPFTVMVSDSEIGRAEGVKVYGRGLSEGETGQPCQFFIDTSDAGLGSLSLSIEGASKADIECSESGDGRCCVTYHPTAPGLYVINILFADQPVQGSPFLVKVSGEVVGNGSELIVDEAQAVTSSELSHIGRDCQLTLKLPGSELSDIRATVTDPSGVEDCCDISQDSPGVYQVLFKPRQNGLHFISVSHQNSAVPGSPFQFTVGPVKNGGAHKVVAVGEGLQSALVCQPGQFTLYTREAGFGRLSLSMEGPSKSDIYVEDLREGTCDVSYKCTEPGDYLLSVKFNDRHITNSPFAVHVDRSTGQQNGRQSRLVDSAGYQINKPASLCVDMATAGDADELRAYVVSPSHDESDAIVQQLDPDRCAVRFVPRENGVHWVHVQHNGVAIPRSPFRCVVGPRECDVSLVTAHGRGLAAGYVGEESEFVVDTSMAGAGALAVSVDGPSKVHLECDEIKSVNQYQFTYRPSAAGLYTVSVKFAGDTHIPGSPFLVNVKGPSHEVLQTSQQRAIHTSSNTDAAQVKARGKGLTEATVNQQTSFTVDSSRAGQSVLLVGVLGPSGPCEEVSVRRVNNTETFGVTYCPSVTGQHMVVVKWGDEHIPGSPFHLSVIADH